MKLQQLRYFLQIYRSNLNISEAAERLFTSQPGISKQIKLLEDELGVPLFVRHGKRIVSLTPPGRSVLVVAERIFRDVQRIRTIGEEFAASDSGVLRVATTQTQARHVLPEVIGDFLATYPNVALSLMPASPATIDRMVADGEVDFGINTEIHLTHPQLRRIGGRPWQRCFLMRPDHPLAEQNTISLADLSASHLVSYAPAQKDAALCLAFANSDLPLPKVVLASADTDIIKTYVREGVGLGLLAHTAYDEEADQDLVCRMATHLFPPEFTHVVLHQDVFLRGYMYDFLKRYQVNLSREHIDAALYNAPIEDFSI